MRAALDCRVAVAPRNDVSMNHHPRGAFRPSFASFMTLLESRRAQGRPGGRCTRGRRAKEICASAMTTGTGGDTPAFPAHWFYGLYVLSPVSLALPPSLSRSFSAIRENLAPAWACQDN